MRLILVRHGYSEHAQRGLIADIAGCPGLAPAGVTQAERLAARLAASGEAAGSRLIASPVKRARQTADLLAPVLATGVEVDPDLRELVPGAADGLTRGEYEARYGSFDPYTEPSRPFSPGGESWYDFEARVRATLARLADDHPGETVVAVTHAGFIVVSMLTLLGMSGPDRAFLEPANAAITEWRREGGRWRLERYNDGAHLAFG